MFPFHNPAQQVFNWHCETNQIPVSRQAQAAEAMRSSVQRIRELYRQPIGCKMAYDEKEFRLAYLLAYFPYYIEPVCWVLQQANLADDLSPKKGASSTKKRFWASFSETSGKRSWSTANTLIATFSRLLQIFSFGSPP